MNLYSFHCGFYDEEISEGIYEFHVNIPIVAENLEAAKKRVRLNTIFQKKKMHIDGIQEIKTVEGFDIKLEANTSQKTVVDNHLHRDL